MLGGSSACQVLLGGGGAIAHLYFSCVRCAVLCFFGWLVWLALHAWGAEMNVNADR